MVSFGVVIPYYNSEQYIERCLSSIIRQTYTCFSVIVVDDHSNLTSHSKLLEIVNSFNDSRISIITNSENLGPSLSRRNGILSLETDYVCFCDSDDAYDQDYLMKMLINSEKGKNDIVFCSYNICYSNGKILKKDIVSRLEGKNKSFLIANGPDSLCCLCFRRSLFQNLEFPNIRNGEDMSIIPILISRANSFGFSKFYLYNYIYREHSLSKKSSKMMINNLSYSFFYVENNLPAEYKDEIEALGVRNYLYGCNLQLLKMNYNREYSLKLLKDFSVKYPNWIKNKYLCNLPRYKKLFLKLYAKRMVFLCFCFSQIHKILSK